MRITIAADKFKGSLSAPAVCEAIAAGIRLAIPECEILSRPIADGGEGTAETIRAACAGDWIQADTVDPLGRPIRARYAWLAPDTAVLDMSEASGLWQLRPFERNPLHTSTFGTGKLMADAIGRGARTLILGLGGSATNDAGAGMAAALGFRFLDKDGQTLDPTPAGLAALGRIEKGPALPRIIAACDVQSPLLGPTGASRLFGPQKGARPEEVAFLEQTLSHMADVVSRDLGVDFRSLPGAGAAGGLGFGLMSFAGAEIQSGFELVSGLIHLEEAIASSALVLTGEGRLDSQTLQGKGPGGVARLARRHGKPVIALVGSNALGEETAGLFDLCLDLTTEAGSEQEAIQNAPALLTRLARLALETKAKRSIG